MRRTKLYSLVALGLSVVTAEASAQSAGLSDIRSVKPVMMLLVDTSGSMERMPDATGCDECLPTCTNSASDSAQKNRWAITLEALTGTFSNFRCVAKPRSTYVGKYDADYFLPHYDFSNSGTQATDGVMDTFRNQVKFGLMTFDGVSTTINGATLVPWTTYGTDAAFKTQILGTQGMFSYPDALAPQELATKSLDTPLDKFGWKPLSFPGCPSVYGVNAGARGKGSDPGSLISVGPSDVGIDTNGVNDSIQSSLVQVRPYGGTPIAGMLDDLRYYLRNDTDIKSGSDPFYSCRERYAILLTDGAPDTLFRNDPRFSCESANDAACSGGNCQCPYDTEPNIASSLITKDGLKKLFLVAFNVNDTVALATLDGIASAGGTSTAYRANNLATLRQNLSDILSTASPKPTSRSVPVVVNTGTAIQLGGNQFEVTAGFKVGATDTDPWEGRLYRRRMSCSGATAQTETLDATKGDMFHTTLTARTATRDIKTVAPASLLNVNGTLTAYNGAVPSFSTVNTMRPDGNTPFVGYAEVDTTVSVSQGLSENNNAFSAFDKTTNRLFFGDANGNGTAAEVADRDQISDYVRGLSANRKGKSVLGDIYHSNPVVQLPIYLGADQISVFDPALRQFYLDLLDTTSTTYPKGNYKPQFGYGRPGVVYVGSNDGVLHAFNLDDWKDKNGTTYGAGYEFWGFVPPALFNKMAATATPTHQFMFDGTPVVKDMVTSRTSAGVTAMKTVLLSAVRGAPAFVALDVTFPDAPKFLWQRSFPYLGNTTGQPALAEVRLMWNGDLQTRAVAILPGGEGVLDTGACTVNQYGRGTAPNTGARSQVRCWKLQGRTLDIVDVETGTLIQEFDGRHFHSPMTGGVAIDGEGLAQTRAAYMSDQDGILWRLSMYGTDPTKWRVMPLWDMYASTATDFSGNLVSPATPAYQAGRVATYPPLLTRDPMTGTMTIVAGTGDVDNLVDAAPNRVVSLKELRPALTGGELPAPTTSTIVANWTLQLDAGEAVTGPLVMLDDTVYFTSFTGPAGGAGNVCKQGISRIVGAHVRQTDPLKPGLPKPRLTPLAGGLPLVLQYTASTDSLLLGLSIARDPVCIPGSLADNNPLLQGTGRINQDPSLGAAGGGAFQVRSMVAGGTGGAVMSGSNTSDTGQRQLLFTLPITNVSRAVGWASSIE